MITEVQLGTSRLHLQYLRKIIARITDGIGMSRRDVEDLQRAVVEVCAISMADAKAHSECKLKAALMSSGSDMIVDIVDTDVTDEKKGRTYSSGLKRVCHLVDGVEMINGCDEIVVRLTKRGKCDTGISAMPYLLSTTYSGLHD